MDRFYYYTKWTFISPPDELETKGPYHSTWITDQTPKEFFKGLSSTNMEEFFWKMFSSEEEMKAYAKSQGL